jgi:hypothetical protein
MHEEGRLKPPFFFCSESAGLKGAVERLAHLVAAHQPHEGAGQGAMLIS